MATSWQDVPDTDPISMANTAPEATVDILDPTGPIFGGGVAGNPYSETTFCSGLYSTDGGAFLWPEGIMQTVTGFTIGNSYDISFFQSVVKQQNPINESVDLIATGTGGTYTWTDPTTLSCVICQTTTASPTITTGFLVTLADSS